MAPKRKEIAAKRRKLAAVSGSEGGVSTDTNRSGSAPVEILELIFRYVCAVRVQLLLLRSRC